MEIQKEESIVVSSTLSKEDFVKANKIIYKMKKDESKFIAYVITFLLMLVIIPISVFRGLNGNVQLENIVQDKPINDVPWYLAFLPTISLVIIIFGFIVFLYIAKNLIPKRHYESNKLIQQEMQYTFNLEGIQSSSERITVKILWNEVFKVYLSKDFLVLFLSNMTVWIIPKIHIASNQIVKLEDIIREKVSKKKVRSSKY